VFNKTNSLRYLSISIVLLMVAWGCQACGNAGDGGGFNGGPGGGTGAVVLSWSPPTTNTDGTPLTDLAGFKIYYGTSPGNYTSSINVGNVTSYTVTDLPMGVTLYFALTAYDSFGYESVHSGEVVKTL